MSSLFQSAYSSSFRWLFPFFLIGLAISWLLISISSDASILRHSPIVHMGSALSILAPALLTFFEAVVPLIFVFGLYKSICADSLVNSPSELFKAIKIKFVRGLAGLWLFIIVVLAAVSILLDSYFVFSVAPFTTSICASIWIGLALWLMKPIRLGPRLILLAISLFWILSIRYVDWNSRKPFVRDLLKIEYGMTTIEVDRTMKKYTRRTESDDLESDVRLENTLIYSHATKGPFYADFGVIRFKDDKVEAVKLEYD